MIERRFFAALRMTTGEIANKSRDIIEQIGRDYRWRQKFYMKVCNPNQQSKILRTIISIWCIICVVLELYKRCWVAFFPIFAVCMGLALQAYIWLDSKPYRYTVTIIFLLLAIIALTIAVIAFVYDIRYCRKKEKEEKIEADIQALKKSFKRMHPEWTDKQAEIAARGR